MPHRRARHDECMLNNSAPHSFDQGIGEAGGLDGAAIRMTGLHKSFGSIHAVRGVDLDIAPGEVVAFLGPNGAGKSTTIDMLLGLTRPDAGSVSVFGDPPVRAVQAGRVG